MCSPLSKLASALLPPPMTWGYEQAPLALAAAQQIVI